MSAFSLVLIGFVAALHAFFCYFEMFAWETLGAKIFKRDPDEMAKTKAMAINQGIYNGFLAAGLVWALLISDPVWAQNVAVFFLVCVVVAGIVGALTVSKKILRVQAFPAALALLSIAVL